MFFRILILLFVLSFQFISVFADFSQDRFDEILKDAQNSLSIGDEQGALQKAQLYIDATFPHRCGAEKFLAQYYTQLGQNDISQIYTQLDVVCTLFNSGNFQNAYDKLPKKQEDNLNVIMYDYYIGRLLKYNKTRPSHSVLSFDQTVDQKILNNKNFEKSYPIQYVLFHLIHYADKNDIKGYNQFYQYVVGKDYLAKSFFIPQATTLLKSKDIKELEQVLKSPDILIQDTGLGVKTSAHSRVYWYYMDEAIVEKNPFKFFENFQKYYKISGQETQLYGRVLSAVEKMGSVIGAEKIIAKEFGSIYELFLESYAGVVPLQDNTKDYKGIFSLEQMVDIEKKFLIVFEYYFRNVDIIEPNYQESSFFDTRIKAPFNIVGNFHSLNSDFFFSDDMFLILARHMDKFPEFMLLRGKDDRNYIQRVNEERKEKSGIYFYGNFITQDEYTWILQHTQEPSMQQVIQVFNTQFQDKKNGKIDLKNDKIQQDSVSSSGLQKSFFVRYGWYIFAFVFICIMGIFGIGIFRKS